MTIPPNHGRQLHLESVHFLAVRIEKTFKSLKGQEKRTVSKRTKLSHWATLGTITFALCFHTGQKRNTVSALVTFEFNCPECRCYRAAMFLSLFLSSWRLFFPFCFLLFCSLATVHYCACFRLIEKQSRHISISIYLDGWTFWVEATSRKTSELFICTTSN